jgi:GNAT superfamily N-acetyltransferase
VTETRRAGAGDIRPLARSLAKAFGDDPVMEWLFGEDARRREARLRRFFGHEAKRHRKHGEVLTSEGCEGAAFWDPPDLWHTSLLDLVRAVPVVAPALGSRLPRTLRGLKMIETAHPRAPHWYLAVLGTEPAAQGKGIGASLLEPILGRCDREGMGAYLESSKEKNILYYQRFGFAVTGEITLPGGPNLWPMWRDPRDDRAGG